MVFLIFFFSPRTLKNFYFLILFQETLFFSHVLIAVKQVTNLFSVSLSTCPLPPHEFLPPHYTNLARETGTQAPQSDQLHSLPSVVEDSMCVKRVA